MNYLQTELTKQIYIFTIFILNGCIIGILFDFFRILRKSFKTNDFITSAQDLFFCIITGILLIYSIFIFNNGEIRFYIILGLIIGLIVYILLFSKYIIKISVNFINIIKKILHIFFIPIKLFITILKMPIQLLYNKFINIIIKKKKNRKFSKNLVN